MEKKMYGLLIALVFVLTSLFIMYSLDREPKTAIVFPPNGYRTTKRELIVKWISLDDKGIKTYNLFLNDEFLGNISPQSKTGSLSKGAVHCLYSSMGEINNQTVELHLSLNRDGKFNFTVVSIDTGGNRGRASVKFEVNTSMYIPLLKLMDEIGDSGNDLSDMKSLQVGYKSGEIVVSLDLNGDIKRLIRKVTNLQISVHFKGENGETVIYLEKNKECGCKGPLTGYLSTGKVKLELPVKAIGNSIETKFKLATVKWFQGEEIKVKATAKVFKGPDESFTDFLPSEGSSTFKFSIS